MFSHHISTRFHFSFFFTDVKRRVFAAIPRDNLVWRSLIFFCTTWPQNDAMVGKNTFFLWIKFAFIPRARLCVTLMMNAKTRVQWNKKQVCLSVLLGVSGPCLWMPTAPTKRTAPQTPVPARSPGFQRVPERALGMALERAVPSAEQIFSYDFLKREHLKKQDHFYSQE